MLNVLFDKTQKVSQAPVWTGFGGLKDYANNLLNYKVSALLDDGNAQMALLIVVALVIFTFFLKKFVWLPFNATCDVFKKWCFD